MTEIDFQKELDSYKFDSTALDGTGGYCFAFFFGKGDDLPNVTFQKLMENLKAMKKNAQQDLYKERSSLSPLIEEKAQEIAQTILHKIAPQSTKN